MRYIFPFNKYVASGTMLASMTMSYISFPILAFIVTHVICTHISALSEYDRKYFPAAVFLFVGIYCIAATTAMYISFFKAKHKNKK